MSAAHLHLITNQLPIILLIIGCLALVISLTQQNLFWKRMPCCWLLRLRLAPYLFSFRAKAAWRQRKGD
jgi:hypothetical protein